MTEHRARLYLISPPAIDLPVFLPQLKEAFSGGDIASFQLRLKGASDDDILKASRELMPMCRDHDAAFILNDRADLAARCKSDGVHLGQDDLEAFKCPHPAPLQHAGEGQGEGKNPLAAVRAITGPDMVIGVSCHDSRHLAMVAGEQGADYVAFGAFYPTRSKSPEKLARYGTPTHEILAWWQAYMLLPCVAIGGITPANCAPLIKAGADFIAVITAVWEHPEGPGKAVREFNETIEKATV